VEVTVRELKSRLSEYLRKVQAGAEIVVTSHGKAVARLVAPGTRPRRKSAEDEAVERLLSQPWIRRGNGGKVRGSDRPTPVPPGTTEAILRWLRGE